MQRRLTVIVSADVVGYSGLMERDEAGTLARLRANRQDIFDPRIAAHGGRIVKLMGDGALVEFASVVSAVSAVLEIQQATEGAPCPPECDRIRYRIGVNLGEVVVEDTDIFGDGVNVAARLQAMAEPGGVMLSRTVRDQVAGKVPAQFDDLGEHSLKNIERPVHVYRARAGPAAAPAAVAASAPRASRFAVCVLPFTNMSGDPEQEYFSDGITEDIITDLSKVAALAVVSRNTAFSFKGKQIDVARVARQLNVSYIVEGSVRKSGNRVRITAQLIDGATDSHLWAERYDRDLDDIFALQDEITEAIAERALALAPDLAEAHAAKGRILGDVGRFDEALSEHRTALSLDPDAYEVNAAAARTFIATGRNDEAIACLEKAAAAIETDFWALGMSIQVHEAKGDLAGTKDAARRTLERVEKMIVAEPDHGTALGFGVVALVAMQEVDRAKAWAERALLLDPDNINLRYNIGCSMVGLREHDMAIELLTPVFHTAKGQNVAWFKTDTTLDPIRDDPRFKALLAATEARLAQAP